MNKSYFGNVKVHLTWLVLATLMSFVSYTVGQFKYSYFENLADDATKQLVETKEIMERQQTTLVSAIRKKNQAEGQLEGLKDDVDNLKLQIEMYKKLLKKQ